MTTQAKVPDWLAIEAEFVAGDMTLADLARTHGQHRQTVSRRATKGGWWDKRRELQAQTAAAAGAALTAATQDRAERIAAQAVARQEQLHLVAMELLACVRKATPATLLPAATSLGIVMDKLHKELDRMGDGNVTRHVRMTVEEWATRGLND